MAPIVYEEKPQPGDLIEIFRGRYQHWAVYIGDGFVVHLAPASEVPGAGAGSMWSVVTDTALVKKEELWDVVGTNRWKINNSLDRDYHPRPAHVIVREARELVGRRLPYSVLTRNCEHFANELRYGKAESRQVRDGVRTAVIGGAAAASVFGVVALAAALFRGNKNENENTQ